MDFTDEDEDYVFVILGEDSHGSPTALQRENTNELGHIPPASSQTVSATESNNQHSDMVNVFNSNIVSGASTRGIGKSLFTGQTFDVSLKRTSTSSENYELQEIDVPKRKCVQNMQIEKDARSICERNLSSIYNIRKEENTTHDEHPELGNVVNNLLIKDFTTDQKFECMANKIAKLELEIIALKGENAKLIGGLKSVNDQNIILSERIDHLEINGICVVCCTEKINIWVNPCQHWVMCTTCFKKLSATLDENTGNRLKKCPVCRENINYAIPYYGI
ncbi:unnamed protein product [Meganyctiphanes norvegica]|uniref:RING-type domain-containing protein n=1 Tax=Meganyctiphanes norvegica TaxID=48144 RepID=A0AAV2QAK9_MEGNR